jgi:hypothetical protein
MIIKVERDGVSARAQQVLQGDTVVHWTVEARRGDKLAAYYRVSGHTPLVDVFAGLVTTAAELLRSV